MHEGMDVSHYLKWLCNERVVRYSEQRHKEHTPTSQYEYLTVFNKPRPIGEDQLWEIVRDGIPIGTITAYRNSPNRTANLGLMIGEPRVWGTGYGPEAWEAVSNYLFEDGIRKLEAGCMASNAGMIKALQKCGFTHEATLPNYFLLDGRPEDMLYYGRYREAQIIPIKDQATRG